MVISIASLRKMAKEKEVEEKNKVEKK